MSAPRSVWSADAIGPALRGVGYVLFFLMIVVPTAYQPLKAPLLALVVGGVGLAALRRPESVKLHHDVLLLLAVYLGLGIAFMVWGAMNDGPGAARVGSVYLLWPVVFSLLAAAARDVAVLRRLAVVVVAGSVVGALYGLSFLGWTLGRTPAWAYVPLDLGQEIGLFEGFVEVSTYSVPVLFFSVPFLITGWLTWDRAHRLLRPATTLVALGICLLMVLVSGRRALWLAVGLSPAFALAAAALAGGTGARGLGRRSVVLAAFTLVPGLVFLNATGADLGALTTFFGDAFSTTRDVGAGARQQQFAALMEGWRESPFIGRGLGTGTYVVRDSQMPWAYELSYVAMLFHTGLVGVLAYGLGFAFVLANLIVLARRSPALRALALPTLVGVLCFLMGNASNPYLQKYDFMWVIFYPVALVNAGLLGGSRASGRDEPEPARDAEAARA